MKENNNNYVFFVKKTPIKINKYNIKYLEEIEKKYYDSLNIMHNLNIKYEKTDFTSLIDTYYTETDIYILDSSITYEENIENIKNIKNFLHLL